METLRRHVDVPKRVLAETQGLDVYISEPMASGLYEKPCDGLSLPNE